MEKAIIPIIEAFKSQNIYLKRYIKDLWYNGKIRPMMIAYEEKGDLIEIVTIHPISKEKIANRVERKRWVPYE